MKNRLLIFVITAVLFAACDIPTESGLGELYIDPDYEGNAPETPTNRTFRAQHGLTADFYDVYADLLIDGEKCQIWGERSRNIAENTARYMAYVYDWKIYPKMMDAFNSGETFYDGTEPVANNPMEYADYLSADPDGKLTILLLDIKDDYSPGRIDTYVAGYFQPWDFIEDRNSNKCDMIYVDVYPGRIGSDESTGTLAHEMQHLINFVVSYAKRSNGANLDLTTINAMQMDLWINEGLSAASEWIWSGKHVQSRIDWYYKDTAGTMSGGNNFYVWDNHDEEPMAILDDYATVYIFFQWLRLQAGSTAIYKDIINSEHSDYQAVTAAANTRIPGQGYSDWGKLLRDWMAANYIFAPSGPYGYKNDWALVKIEPYTVKADAEGRETPWELAPGEGMYTTKTSMPPPTAYIKYAGLPARYSSGGAPNDTSMSGAAALLTYNVNTDIKGAPSDSEPFNPEIRSSGETGSGGGIAGGRIAANVGASSGRRVFPEGPYPVGMGDLLRQKGFARERSGFSLKKTREKTGSSADE